MDEEIVDLAALEDLEQHLGRGNLLRVVEVQLSHSESQTTKLRSLCGAPNANDLHFVAHQIAGASGSLGLRFLGTLAVEIETKSLNADDVTVMRLAASLLNAAEQSREKLRELFPELNESAAS